MKISSQFLFKIIFELSKKDMQFFLKKLELQNQLDCAALFQAIIIAYEKNPSSNISTFEKNLKQNLSSKISKFYRVNKSKLKKELLQFLSSKNLEKNIRFQLREQVNIGVSLAELGHNSEGLKIIENVKAEAIKQEYFEEVLYALNKIRKYKLELRGKSDLALAFNKEFSHYQKVLNNLNDYVSLSFYLYSFQNDFSADLKNIQNLKNHDLLSDETKALSLTAKKFYFLGRLDVHNALKEYEEMYEIILAGVKYAEEANKQNENFANTLLLMYSRLEFVSTHLKKYDKSLEAIDLISNFPVPKIYENNLFFYKMKNVIAKTKKLHIYSITANKKLYPYCKALENNLNKSKIGVYDLNSVYYKLLYNYTVKLSKHQDACALGKVYIKFVLDNIDKLNSQNNLTIQSFLCYMCSAYVNYTEDTFEYLFEFLFKKKNAKYFIAEDAPFSYVFKLYNVFILAFKEGFYAEEVLVEYYDIWKEIPNFLPKANCIPKEVFKEIYEEELVKTINDQYETVKFVC